MVEGQTGGDLHALDPDSLSKPAKDPSSKAQAYTFYQKKYNQFPPDRPDAALLLYKYRDTRTTLPGAIVPLLQTKQKASHEKPAACLTTQSTFKLPRAPLGVQLNPEDTMKLGVLFPSRKGEPPLIGIPLTNPMGWKSSPPNFCAFNKTIADLANATLSTGLTHARRQPYRLNLLSEAHPLDGMERCRMSGAANEPTAQSTTPSRKPVRYWDVYVDDFCGLAQDNQWTRRAIKRVLFQSLDKVFWPLDATDTPFRQELASLKKMLKGDATWTTKKVILGWLIDSITKTISLPPHQVDRLQEILHSISPDQCHVPIQQWHQVLGELRQRLRLTKRVHSFLRDFQWLVNDLSHRPTSIAELVPDTFPATLGACDASGTGMGGIFFVPLHDGTVQPLMWRQAFPKWVPTQLVTFDNPGGTITNTHNDILAQAACVQARTTHNCYDNTAAVYWQQKGATTTTGPAAYLLRIQALHQRLHQYVPLRDYIPGPVNRPADLLSSSHAFCSDLGSIQKTMRASVTELYAKCKDAHWNQWVFAKRLHDGQLSCSHKPLRSRTVSDTIRSVGQTLARLGSKDPRTNSTGSLDFRLTAQFKGYAKLDPAPSRVKPVPITLVMHALWFAYYDSLSPPHQAIANMICIAFFFCLRPGEYTGTTRDDQAFSLQDVAFYLGSHIVHHDGPVHELQVATPVTLTFTTEKSGDKGEVVAHARSGDSLYCPIVPCVRQVLHLRSCCPPSSPFSPTLKLASYFDNGVLTLVRAATVTSSMRVYAQILYIPLASPLQQSLLAPFEQAGLWSYYRATATLMSSSSLQDGTNLASVMFNNGTYSFLPEEWLSLIPLGRISHPRGLASMSLLGPVSIPLPPGGLWPNGRKGLTAKALTAQAHALDPNSLNKPAKDPSSKAQAYTFYQKKYNQFPVSPEQCVTVSLNQSWEWACNQKTRLQSKGLTAKGLTAKGLTAKGLTAKGLTVQAPAKQTTGRSSPDPPLVWLNPPTHP
eukprot:jgi/Psemu1/11292/gm1.11292_g